YDAARDEQLVFVANFTPVPREAYRIGAPCEGTWQVLLNSDDSLYGGSGYPAPRSVTADAIEAHGRAQSIELTVPPLSVIVLAPVTSDDHVPPAARPVAPSG